MEGSAAGETQQQTGHKAPLPWSCRVNRELASAGVECVVLAAKLLSGGIPPAPTYAALGSGFESVTFGFPRPAEIRE